MAVFSKRYHGQGPKMGSGASELEAMEEAWETLPAEDGGTVPLMLDTTIPSYTKAT
jgi:hypothetical protein